MASAAMRFCATPRCPEKVVGGGHCPAHRRQRDRARGSRHERGYDNPWAEFSKKRLARFPWCVGYPKGAHEPGRKLAEVTDHIISIKQRPDLRFAEENLQSLCTACNLRKAIAEEGGFGRGRVER